MEEKQSHSWQDSSFWSKEKVSLEVSLQTFPNVSLAELGHRPPDHCQKGGIFHKTVQASSQGRAVGPAVSEHIAICLLLEKNKNKNKTLGVLFVRGSRSREWLLGEKQQRLPQVHACLLFNFLTLLVPDFNILQQLFSFNFTYPVDGVDNGFTSFLDVTFAQ